MEMDNALQNYNYDNKFQLQYFNIFAYYHKLLELTYGHLAKKFIFFPISIFNILKYLILSLNSSMKNIYFKSIWITW